jgi:hypothetical protein
VPYQFKKHYTREEARALLPKVRQWLDHLASLRSQFEKVDRRVTALINDGADAGGDSVNNWIRIMADIRETAAEFQVREIMVKDVERGLVDFPSIIGGKEVFLCWEKDEDDIEFWHDLDTGYAGREKL